jgi:hypothetical protein
MIKFVGTTAVPKFDHGRTGLRSPDGAGLTLTYILLGRNLPLHCQKWKRRGAPN